LRAELEGRGVGYVLAVARDYHVGVGGTSHRADELLRLVPARVWQCVSAGKGAKGHRYYDWAFVRLDHDGPPPVGQAGRHWLLVRRNRSTGELAFYRCFTPRPAPLAVLVKVAGRRWTVEESFQTARAFVAWTSTRCAAGGPGTAGPRWRCSPTPSWSWLRWPSAPATRHHLGWSRSPAMRSSTCSRHYSCSPAVIATTGCAGRPGGGDIRPAPVPATTNDRPRGNREDHGRWLEQEAPSMRERPACQPASGQTVGWMFWFSRKKFVGS
jgi:hypothetical protein